MANYTYKYRIYPNETQQVLLNKHFGCVRFIYNHFLNQRVDAYMQDLTLDDREWVCPRCNVKHDRDLNAAKNIRKQGIATAGTAGLAWGAEVRPKCDETFVLRHSVLKQETPTL